MSEVNVINPPNDMVIERQGDDWIARLVTDKRVWEAGKTMAEAVGKLYISASEQIVADILKAQKQIEAEEELLSESARRAQDLVDWDNEQHRLAQEAREN